MDDLVQTPANPQVDLDWYKPGKSLREFHACNVPVRVLIGGRGSGKTTSVAVEVVGHGLHNAGAKIYILRKTQDSNEDTTLDTFEQVFRRLGTGFEETKISLFKKSEGGKHFRIPSLLAIKKFNEYLAGGRRSQSDIQQWLRTVGDALCAHINFAGVPSSNYRATRFRGYECSMLVFVEADQLDSEDLDLGMACLRWKGADPTACDEKGFIKDTCVILDTNPPATTHWIAKRERSIIREHGMPTSMFNAKSIITTSDCFWHIPTEENRFNLPDKYIEKLDRQYARNPAMRDRMLLGLYADAFDGQPVLYNFTQEHSYEALGWPKGAYLVRGWDFGTTHAVIWSAYFAIGEQEYWWDLLEYFAEQSDTERQCIRVRELTEQFFPFWNDRELCSGVKDFCDPAGAAKKDTGSSLKVLHTHGYYPAYARRGLQETIALYNRLLDSKDKHGNFIYRIDKTNCPKLYTASCGGYRYPNQGEAGYGSNEPLKGESAQNFDHPADASRYAKVGCLRLLKEPEAEIAHGPVGRLVHRLKVNPIRRF
jgi:hypothetical protein